MKNNWKRYQKAKHIKRKQRIIKEIYKDNEFVWDKNQPNRLDGLKIHCSCPMCSAKSKNRGARRKHSWNWEPTYNWKISDWRKIEAMNADMEEADV